MLLFTLPLLPMSIAVLQSNTQGIERAPDCLTGWYQLAMLHVSLFNYQNTLECTARARRLMAGPRSSATFAAWQRDLMLARAKALHKTKQSDRAVAILQKLLEVWLRDGWEKMVGPGWNVCGAGFISLLP